MALSLQSLEMPQVHEKFHGGQEWHSQLGVEGELKQGRDRAALGHRCMSYVWEALILLKQLQENKISAIDFELKEAKR